MLPDEERRAPLLLVCANTASDASYDESLIVAQPAKLADRAARRDVRIGYEALAWSSHVDTNDKVFHIVEAVARPNFGLILDSFHTLIRPDDWSSLRDLSGDMISFLQVGDAKRKAPDYLTSRRHHSALPGHGDLDVAAFFRPVMATGYAGPLSLEIFNEGSQNTVADVAAASKRALDELAVAVA